METTHFTSSVSIPADVLEQFDASGGAPGEWLMQRYSTGVLRYWWAQWLEVSPKGRSVAKSLEDQAIAEWQAHQERTEHERKQREEEEAAKREQEHYRLPPGIEVIVSHPQTHIDGQKGRVLKSYWRGRELVTDVLIDPLPPSHPEEKVPVRMRRSGLMPFSVTVGASTLRVLTQPET
jgi:hypothetical protein